MSSKRDTVVVVRKIQLLVDTKEADEVRLKLSETSRENTTYQVLSAMYKGQIPMNMMASLNHSLPAQPQGEA